MSSKPWLPWTIFAVAMFILVGIAYTGIAVLTPAHTTPAAVITATTAATATPKVTPCIGGAKFNVITGAVCPNAPVVPAYTFTKVLAPGSVGPAVKALQRLLNSDPATRILGKGAGSPGKESTYYGPGTMLAVGKFQLKYRAQILTSVGLKKPTGIVGASTIKQLNAVEVAIARAKISTLASTLTTSLVPSAPLAGGVVTQNLIGANVGGGGFSSGGGGGGGGGSGGGGGCVVPTITSSLSASGNTGSNFTYNITASGDPTITYSTGSLPGGLSLSAQTISGTPASAGTPTVSITATNGCGHDTETLSLTITSGGGGCVSPAITSSLTDFATQNSVYSYTLSAAGTAPFTYTATNLPSGVSFSSPTISGTPTVLATTNVSVSATNACGTDNETLSLTVNQAVSWQQNASGFTALATSSDSQVIYVSSSSGNDSNNGLSPQAPVQTLNKARSLVRDGYPDWILLKRGDTFNSSDGGSPGDSPSVLLLNWGGRSASEPTVIGAYGTGARPILDAYGNAAAIDIGSQNVNHIAITGLNLTSSQRNPNSPNYAGDGNVSDNSEGILWLSSAEGDTDLLVEDCVMSYFDDAGNFSGFNGGRLSSITFRRNIVMDDYNTGGSEGGHSQGVIFGGVDNVLIEQNVFDHNGWNEQIPDAGANSFNQEIYIQHGNTGVTVRENIIANSAGDGLQLRSGGTMQDNIFADDPLAGFVSGGDGAVAVDVPVATSIMTGNVVLNGLDMPGVLGGPRGWGLDVNPNYGPNPVTVLVDNNVLAHNTGTGSHGTWLFNDIQSPELATGISNVTVSNNTYYNWSSPSNDLIIDQPTVGTNTLTNNTFDGTGYSDPDRTLASYNVTLGGANSDDAFLAAAESRPTGTWNDNYGALAAINYVREGFNLSDLVAPPSISFSPASASVNTGSGTTLTWSTSGASSCTASGGWSGSKATSGSQSTGNLTSTTAFTLTCTGTGGSSSAGATVTVTQPLAIDIAAISGVVVPSTGATPTASISATSEYTAAISWSPTDNPFAGSTAYTATITLTPKFGYTVTGITSNFFTVSGASSVTNSSNSGVVTAVFPATQAAANLTNGLLAYYPFDGSVADTSGNANNGTAVGSPSYITGQLGQAISLDGTSQYVDTANYADNLSSISVAAWIQVGTGVSGSFLPVVYKMSSSGSSGIGWGVNIFHTLGNYEIGYLQQQDGSTYNEFTSHDAITDDGGWHFIVLTQGGGLNSVPDMYIDGANVSIDDHGSTKNLTTTSNALNVRIGATGSGDKFFPGSIDEVRVYNRALNSDEVSQLYNQGLAYFKTPQLQPQTEIASVWQAVQAWINGLKKQFGL